VFWIWNNFDPINFESNKSKTMDETARYEEMLPNRQLLTIINGLQLNILNGRGARQLAMLHASLINATTLEAENRMIFLFEDGYLISNLVYCYRDVDRCLLEANHDEVNVAKEFLKASFDLLRQVMIRSVRARTHLIRGRILINSIYPYCTHPLIDFNVARSLVGVLIIYYDNQWRGMGLLSFQVIHNREETVRKAEKSLMSCVYGGDHFDIDTFYDRTERSGRHDETASMKTDRIFMCFATYCFVDLERRSNMLISAYEAQRYVSTRQRCCRNNHMRRIFNAIVDCNEKIMKQSVTEEAIVKAALLLQENVLESETGQAAKKKQKPDDSNNQDDGFPDIGPLGFILKRALEFLSENFDV